MPAPVPTPPIVTGAVPIRSTDKWSPDVWATLATREFKKKAIIGTSPAVVTDDSLVGNPGDTIVFPRWGLLTEMDDITEDQSLVPEKLTQDNSKATIKEAGKAVEIRDLAKITGIGDPQSEAIRQFGILAARKVDADLITASTAVVTGGITYADGTKAIDSAPLKITVPSLSWGSIVDSTLLFGDDFDSTDFAGIYINSAQAGALLKDKDFIAAAQTASGNSQISSGLIGSKMGLSFYVTDRLAANKALLLKNRSLGLMYKRRPLIEQDRDILARTTVVTINQHYAVKRLMDDGVVDVTIGAGA